MNTPESNYTVLWVLKIVIQSKHPVHLLILLISFHIDFGGTSVFYHIISGSKTFYFIEPTIRNLDIYSTWSTSPGQGNTFLGDLIPDCQKITLLAGNTLFIPSGWVSCRILLYNLLSKHRSTPYLHRKTLSLLVGIFFTALQLNPS